MIQAGTLNLEMPFRSELIKRDSFEKKKIGFDRNRPDTAFENSINNYLKTPAEMDADFCLEMGEHHSQVKEWIMLKKDGYIINAYGPDYTHSGFMEENY
jgi:hypothetical protein